MRSFLPSDVRIYSENESYAVLEINASLDPNVFFVNVIYCIGPEQLHPEQFKIQGNLDEGLQHLRDDIEKLPQWRWAVYNEQKDDWE